MSIDDDRQISRFVSDRLPEFVRIDHPTLVAFLEAYYEWLDLRRDSGLVVSPMAMHDIPDVDTSLEQFIDNFKSQYLFNFPDSLAINKETNEPVDVRRLIKNIKQFYLAKGTEKSYEFLFRIFYDTNVEFYYPKKDILKLSSGRWTQNNYLRISNSLGDQIYRAAGNLLIQKNSKGEIVATARVVSVNVYQVDSFDVAELLISNRNGTFQAGELGVEFTDGNETFKEIRVYTVVSTVNITNGGTNYQLGERVNFDAVDGDYGQRGYGTVAEVDAVGAIRRINIDDFGINYSVPPNIRIESSRGDGFQGTAVIGALCQSFGYYVNNDGRLSTNKVLQDNHYYQNWSYVLKAEVVIDTYRELIRRLVHPVGTGMFGSVLIKRCNRANLDNASALMSFRIPYIGNYTPYTFQTFDDLSLWFQESITGGMTASGYLPSAHDQFIQGSGNRTAIIGNPISNNIEFKDVDSGWLSTPGFPNADPFWIVYPHPNKQVERGYHYARVWKSQFDDFATWPEWINNQEFSRERQDRFDSFQNFQTAGGSNTQSAIEGGVAGEESGVNCDWPANCIGRLQFPGSNSSQPFCCCVFQSNGSYYVPAEPQCQCEGGQWKRDPDSNEYVCTCPYGHVRQETPYGYVCDCQLPLWWECYTVSTCPPGCGGQCCPVVSPNPPYYTLQCPDPVYGCNFACLDPVYRWENCCECEPFSWCCDDNGGCLTNPLSENCYNFCRLNPLHPLCSNRCAQYPCGFGCGRECNPNCPQFDPCLTTCPGFDYCITGALGWSQSAIQKRAEECPEYGPCFANGLTSCFDKCKDAGCAGYDPCHLSCEDNLDPCGITCPNPCLCDSVCNQSCEGFDWCLCDPVGLTCCANNPCLPGCNPDYCDPNYANGECYNPCHPSCITDPCDPSCPGYGPCHPDCPEVPGDRNRRPCNPNCPGFAPCTDDCRDLYRELCCDGGCNCGDGGGVGDPIYRDLDRELREWKTDNPTVNPFDNNLCNNDISRCRNGKNSFDFNSNIGTLLKYDENSEFRKITMRAFFNMPSGQAFDCREETIAAVALPQFVVQSPIEGSTYKETSNPNRPLVVKYSITNQENIGYYKIKQVNIYIDNRLRSTVAINSKETVLLGIQDGRRTLKLEMIDEEGNLVAGTQKIVLFGYLYSPPRR